MSRKRAMNEAIFMDLIRWKNSGAVKVQRYVKAPENYFFFLPQRCINYFILPFCFSFSYFFFSRNTNYAYYLDEVVSFKILKETNCLLHRVWKYQVLLSFFFLATLENRPLLEPFICLILSKKSYVKFLKNLSLSLALSRARSLLFLF